MYSFFCLAPEKYLKIELLTGSIGSKYYHLLQEEESGKDLLAFSSISTVLLYTVCFFGFPQFCFSIMKQEHRGTVLKLKTFSS